jgi:hypothetical protein
MDETLPVMQWDPAVEKAYDAIIEAVDHSISLDGGDWDSWRNGQELLRWADPTGGYFALTDAQREDLINALGDLLIEQHERVRARRDVEREERYAAEVEHRTNVSNL